MGNVNAGGVEGIPSESDETNLRGAALGGSEQKKSVDHAASAKSRDTDATLRLDGEEDTLYDDGLEVEDDSRPLTGQDGKDDSQG
jgi:hypothetical protein